MIRLTCLLLLLTSFVSCSREAPGRGNDGPAYLLKSVTVHGLPSPYFSFAYNSEKRLLGFSHERDIYKYQIQYKSGEIFRVVDTATLSRDSLTYQYSGKLVSRIDIANASERKLRHVSFEYDPQRRAERITWVDDVSGLAKKQLVFRYNGNNLSGYDLWISVSGSLMKLSTCTYLEYDDKENPFPNDMVKDDHFLYLPGVRLLWNNPVSYVITGVSNDFRVTQSYSYMEGLPVTKTSLMEQTRGPGAGMRVTGTTRYSYF
ncbi:MAG: hypothetical protein EOO00_11535 [Chitinophagaceae bacterium]|nr:MAG: hypothetical protein EOO00_11535 [Chitinophagaceae bacterium]